MEQRLNSVCLYVISDTRRDINYTLTKESYDLSYFIFFPLIFFHPFLTSILLLLRFPVLSRINAMQHLVPTIYQLYPDLRLIPLEKHVVDFYLILVVYGMVVFLLQNMQIRFYLSLLGLAFQSTALLCFLILVIVGLSNFICFLALTSRGWVRTDTII